MNYVSLHPLDLVLAATLLIANAGISIAFSLGLERSMAVAAVRMVLQLVLAGLVLKFVFELSSPWLTVAIGVVMVAAAGWEALARQERRILGWRSWGLSTGALLVVGALATVFAVAGVIKPDPWYAPRYVLPLLGMILGNALTGVALALDTVTATAAREKPAIEGRLALGATRLEAMDDVLRRALRTGMMPILNAMAATGVVSLPGMMTGQILAGLDPLEAAKYQIMIMFVLAGATALAVLAATFGAVLLLTDTRHRLRLDRLGASTR